MPKPNNIILSSLSGTAGGVYSPTPIVNNASALVFYINAQVTKKIKGITVSLSKNPFVAGGGLVSAANGSPMNNEVFGRLTVFRDFSQDPSNLFDPYFDIAYTNALLPPNSADYYGPRVNYQKDPIILDVVISKINVYNFDLHGECFNDFERLCVVLSPFYNAFVFGSAVRIFGEYMGDELIRTISVQGCQGYGGG